MTGPEHYETAQAHLDDGLAHDAGSPAQVAHFAQAQVHATLALAGVLWAIRLDTVEALPNSDIDGWSAATTALGGPPPG